MGQRNVGFIPCNPLDVALHFAQRAKTCLAVCGSANMEEECLAGAPNTVGELYRRTTISARLPDGGHSDTFEQMINLTTYAKVAEVCYFRSSVAGGYAYLKREETTTFDVIIVKCPQAIGTDSHELDMFVQAF